MLYDSIISYETDIKTEATCFDVTEKQRFHWSQLSFSTFGIFILRRLIKVIMVFILTYEHN